MTARPKKRTIKPLPPIPENIIKRNLEWMRFVVNLPNFKKAISELRLKFGIAADGLKTIAESEKLKLDLKKSNRYNKFLTAVENLTLKESKLPYNFTSHVMGFLLFNNISAPVKNYDIVFDEGERWAKWISIRTYIRLTKKETEMALQELFFHQRLYFPKSWTDEFRPSRISANEKFELEQRLSKRTGRKITKKLSLYLERVKKQYGQKVFEETKIKHPHGIIKVKSGYTSKEVAGELLGGEYRADTARTRLVKFKQQKKKIRGY